jgi:hypothetical protein
MSNGNGIDIAAVYQPLTEVAQTVVVNRHDRKLDDLTTDIAGLRETLTRCHARALGHGVLYSELQERARRIERHLKLEPAAS